MNHYGKVNSYSLLFQKIIEDFFSTRNLFNIPISFGNLFKWKRIEINKISTNSQKFPKMKRIVGVRILFTTFRNLRTNQPEAKIFILKHNIQWEPNNFFRNEKQMRRTHNSDGVYRRSKRRPNRGTESVDLADSCDQQLCETRRCPTRPLQRSTRHRSLHSLCSRYWHGRLFLSHIWMGDLDDQ